MQQSGEPANENQASQILDMAKRSRRAGHIRGIATPALLLMIAPES